MKTEDLIPNILQEFTRRKARGEREYMIKDFYGFFYVNKHFSEEEMAAFSVDGIFQALQYFSDSTEEIIANNTGRSADNLNESPEYIFPYRTLFMFCTPDAAKHLSEDQLTQFLEYYSPEQTMEVHYQHNDTTRNLHIGNRQLPFAFVLDLVLSFLKHNPLSQRLIDGLHRLKRIPVAFGQETRDKKIDAILEGKGEFSQLIEAVQPTKPLSAKELATGKKWLWLQQHELQFTDDREAFYALMEELSQINYFKRSELSPELRQAISRINPDEFEVFVLDLYNETMREGKKRSAWFVGEKVVAFKAFVWLMYHLETPNRYSILTKLAEKCFTKIPRVGPTSRKLGDVVLRTLAESETIEGLGVLLNLKARAKYPVLREALDASIRNAINYTKLDPREVEDYFINDYGLVNGEVAVDFGDYRSKITVEDFTKVTLTWFKLDGNIQKTVPAKVKADYASELKLWKAKHKDIKKELSGQKQRLEGFWQKEKQWAFAKWKKYLLDHELIRYLSRKLIWQFEYDGTSTSAMYYEGELVGSNGGKATISEDSTVSLWHPSSASVEEVQAWRNYILNRELKQAFKQAYREIYLVTDAEIETATYSNRFLNHVVRHQKLVALAKQRTWVYQSIYAHYDPYIDYRDHKIRATFDLGGRSELATTGRVHFRDMRKREAIRMEDVPTIIFSETMRDVDLFVGVCSIGIEEEWNQAQHRNYWRSYSTSDLSETAKTRRAILANMLPKLSINEQCELTDRYLKVEGKVRTYKIHLGSGNILMEPNDQYLCIVPDRSRKGAADNLFLPFDDDAMFSIILSKAFLLAEDDKITDQVILNQLKR